jgi:hypothetical protein
VKSAKSFKLYMKGLGAPLIEKNEEYEDSDGKIKNKKKLIDLVENVAVQFIIQCFMGIDLEKTIEKI